MSQPNSVAAVVTRPGEQASGDGSTFCLRDWRGTGPPLHVHHHDDEAWHVLEGTLNFRLGSGERRIEVQAGGTVFVPAGVPHTWEAPPDARYLLVLTPRLRDLIAALHAGISSEEAATVYRSYDSELLG